LKEWLTGLVSAVRFNALIVTSVVHSLELLQK
jgi:hypothetical protein